MAQTKVRVLGTGGTIAGRATTAGDNVGYKAAQLAVPDLLEPLKAAAPWWGQVAFDAIQVAQIDSKDMDVSTWWALVAQIRAADLDPAVSAVVVTHGTDTLEETAFFLDAVLTLQKPVVLTCAMRPATAFAPDGPQNLLDALAVALDPDTPSAVWVLAAGVVHAAASVCKVHPYKVDAFSSGETGPAAFVEEGRIRWLCQKNNKKWALTHEFKAMTAINSIGFGPAPTCDIWPRVEWLTSHAGAGGWLVDACLQPQPGAPRVAGLVVAGTGNGTLHTGLLAALRRAEAAGVVVWRTTRCAQGQVVTGASHDWPPAVALPPAKARVALALELWVGSTADGFRTLQA